MGFENVSKLKNTVPDNCLFICISNGSFVVMPVFLQADFKESVETA